MILIRADASTALGTGHALRCLALTQAIRDRGGAVTLAAARLPDAIAERYQEESADVVRFDVEPASEADIAATLALAARIGAAWLVVDGYPFDDAFVDGLADRLSLLVVDDRPRDVGTPALLLNQNTYATRADYPNLHRVRLLLGGRYALLRREYAARRPRRSEDDGRNLLVTLGGADPGNVTARVVSALTTLPKSRFAEVRIVIGAAHPDGEAVARAAGAAGFRAIRDTRDMLALEDWASLAIASAGTTSLELASRGTPTIHAVLADNQVRVAAEMVRRGVALSAGPADAGFEGRLLAATEALQDPERRAAMSAAGRRLVDGHGAGRVAARLLGGEPGVSRRARAAPS